MSRYQRFRQKRWLARRQRRHPQTLNPSAAFGRRALVLGPSLIRDANDASKPQSGRRATQQTTRPRAGITRPLYAPCEIARRARLLSRAARGRARAGCGQTG
ncbi:hypothetical protein EVAR_93336_1 [Eumeta japonica]|uniref:Uncharacterized protein n=1 Tax=Eumeta variegata TaxID=151549 RepID=A0A4C1UTA0_EUMVA|nr:hypothetical protein EVAR_93336_1 [Eumeta japonica]